MTTTGDTSTMDVARKAFANRRDSFVVYIQELSTGDPLGQDVGAIQYQLRRIAHSLSTWTDYQGDPNQAPCPCFADRCAKLAEVVIEVADRVTIQDEQIPVMTMKMFNMLAIQLGRLTLDGHREEDVYALGFDRMAREEDRRWEIKSQGPDDGRAALLFGLWTRLNRIAEPDPSCTCDLGVSACSGQSLIGC
ncbi:uncharacterized protein N7515_001908 [Penicillium bovifimosum]|uniref:Uncharacterized protein n=1 Tax=Penicillium bovifimosum TaxID=126998 RepID=A0A9W9HCE5_9EURO|nr:uncharacterized protein N7515_001908 [Penicillium bovifimosum]KAJ5143121.1 hypothetical protein N7515_001908 [Penicillium bovifimosum]